MATKPHAPITIAEQVARAQQLVDYLEAYGVHVDPEDDLSARLKELGALPQIIEAVGDKDINQLAKEDPEKARSLVQILGRNMGLLQLGTLVPRVQGTKLEAEGNWRRDLRHVPRGDSNHFGMPKPVSEEDPGDRNHQFELICAALFNSVADDVVLDEPDIRLTFRGVRYGVACKALHSQKTAAKNYSKGASQIADWCDKAGLDCGIVLIEATNIFPHQQMVEQPGSRGPYRVFSTEDAAKSHFNELVKQTNAPQRKALSEVEDPIDPRVRGALFVTQTVALVREDHPRIMYGCDPYDRNGSRDNPDALMVEFNEALRNYLRVADPRERARAGSKGVGK